MPDPADAPCQFLEWDSQFFGRRIGRVQGNRLTRDNLAVLETWCREQGMDCVYLLADANDAETARLAAAHHFWFVDARVTLEADLKPGVSSPADEGIRPAVAEDLPKLQQIARKAHYDSRFFFDNRFDPALSEAMFATWIEKSLHKIGGRVFVAERQGQVAGYIACQLPLPECGQIDLIAVAESAQGQGLGRALIATARNWFQAQDVARVRVVTQGRNVRAQRLYQRAGFVTQSLELWYHRWFDRATP